MVDPQLEKALESREVLRLQDSRLDVRVYDTGQILVLGIDRKDNPTKREGNRRIVEEIEIPVQATLDLRSGRNSYYLDTRGIQYIGIVGGSAHNVPCFHEALSLLQRAGFDLNKWHISDDYRESSLLRYPELSEFVRDLHTAFVDRKWERHELAIKGFLPTLAGHGNMHPLAILHPRVMWAYVAGTVFPFERKNIFNFEKGRRNLEGRADYMSSAEGASYDGNAVLIRPWGLSQENERDHTVIQAHFFNPANYQRFLDGELQVENPLPSAGDWMFEVTYGVEYGEKWLRFSASRFDYQHVQKEGLLDKKTNDIYLKAEGDLVDTLEKIAPLPL